MKEASYWTEIFPLEKIKKPFELSGTCEVAIIGGGLTGLSTGLHLARNKASTVLFEQHTIGWGASTRNAGMALTGLKPIPEELFESFGNDLAKGLYDTSLQAIDFAESLIAREKIDCDFSRCGALWAACKPSHFQSFRASQAFLKQKVDHETEIIPPSEMRKELDTDIYHGGLIDPVSAGLNPAKLVSALAKSASQSGLKIFENTPVLRISRTTNGLIIKTTRGEILAKEVVAATNGYTPAALPYFRRRVLPIGSYIIATEPLDRAIADMLIPRKRMVFDTKNFLHYFRMTPDNRLLFGGRNSFTPITNKKSAEILQAAIRKVFPQLENTRVDYAWHGKVGYPFDHLPHIGVHDGLHYALGFCGHGVVMSLFFGSQLAKAINGEKCDLPFWGMNFPAKIFFRKRPWFLPLAGAYYKILDWLS
jgi:glycine/D-amino acid oxidase-like deaminating enzyme